LNVDAGRRYLSKLDVDDEICAASGMELEKKDENNKQDEDDEDDLERDSHSRR